MSAKVMGRVILYLVMAIIAPLATVAVRPHSLTNGGIASIVIGTLIAVAGFEYSERRQKVGEQ